MKITLDTNVLISALIKSGNPRKLMFMIINGNHEIVLSKEILEEFFQIASYPKIRKYVSIDDAKRFLENISIVVRMIKITSKFKVVKNDPDDDIILRTCYDGKSKYLVSGDRHLLELGKFRQTKIVTIHEMIDVLISQNDS